MKLRLAALVLFCTCLTATYAVQPVEAGLQPLYDRINTIASEQKMLDHKLQASDIAASERAASFRRFKVIEAGRQKLAGEVLRAR